MRLRFTTAALGVIAITTLFVAANAQAFCRTRTKGVEADYDASEKGCSLEGVPLFWNNACVGYSITKAGSKKISYEVAADNISQAAQASAPCVFFTMTLPTL